MRLSIIIPTLDEEIALPETLASVLAATDEFDAEVIVVDGGSADLTVEAARAAGDRVRVLSVDRGRGLQMNAGARIANGDALLFLHADTLLPARAVELIEGALADRRVVGGNFRLRFEPRSRTADLFTWCYNLRSKLRVFYGDSAIYVRRETFDRIGGYRVDRIMEDLDLARRLRREGRVVTIFDAEVISSSRRFRSGWQGARALAVWIWLHVLFFLGVSQEALERRYPKVR